MTDEQMDARLRRAGAAWRDATPAAADVEAGEPHSLTTPAPAPARRRRTGLFASAAIVAAALVAGGSVLVANITGDGGHPKATTEAGLTGTVWRLLGYGDQLQQNSLSTLYLGADGTLIADDTCTLIGARADTGGGRLALTHVEVRYYNCTDSVGEVTFDPDLLAADPTFSIDADGLTIAGGGKAMHLVPAPELPAPTLDRPTFVGASWRLVQASDAGGAPVDAGQDTTFRADGGRFETSVSCNTVSGDLTYDGARAELAAITSTTLPCPAPQPVDEVLGAVFQPGRIETRVLGTQLTISRDGAGSLTYEWVPSDTDATDPAKLTNRLWHLTSVAGNPVRERVVVNVHSDGTVTGYDGCRELGSARGHASPGTLTVTGIPPADFQSANCNSDLATTVDSLLTQQPALWRITEGGELVVNGPGTQGFALVFQLGDPNPAPDPSRPPALTGTPWSLLAAKDADGGTVPVAGSGSFQVDADGHVTGNDGCNYLSGDVQLGDHTVDFTGGLATTEMACLDDGVMATADFVHTVLTGSVDWSVDGDRLTLYRAGAGTLIYQAGAPSTTSTDPADLIGTDWTLTTIQTGTGPDGTAHSVTGNPTLSIDPSRPRSLQWSDGCNYNTGKATVGDGTLDIEAKGGTLAYCDQGAEVWAVLAGRVSWQITDGQLTITKDGVGALVYTRQASAPADLIGTSWALTEMRTENANSGSGSGSPDRSVVLTIRHAGTYRLETGCNAYEGSAAVSGQRVTFGNQQDLGGDDCLNTFAQELVDFLDGPMTWSIDGSTLTLTQGNTTATFSG